MIYKKFFKLLQTNWTFILIICVVSFFFWPIFKGYIPFPGELLAGEYVPYNSNSYFGIPPSGVANKGQGFDILRMIFPWKEFAIESLKNWQIPFWNPYNFSGTPFLANLQNGFFYPFNLFFLLLPKLEAWTIYIIVQPFLAAVFTYLFLRKHNLSKLSSLFGGLVFAFSSYMVVWMEYGNIGHSILWLPLVLLLIEKLIDRRSAMTSLLLVLSLTFSFLAGYIQTSIYLLIFSAIYSLVRLYQEKKLKFREVINLAVLFVFPILISSVQLIPSVELFLNSAREAYTADVIPKLLIPPMHLITGLAPDFFGNPATRNYFLEGTYIERVSYFGIIPLMFLSLAIRKNNSRIFPFFFLLCLIVLLLSFKSPISVFLYSLKIPIIGTGVPTRIMFLFLFSASICSAVGLDLWLKTKNTRLVPQLVVLTGIFLTLWLTVIFMPRINNDPKLLENLLISQKNLILPSFVFISGAFILIISKFFKKKNILVFLFFALLLFEQFYFFKKITPFSPREFFYPTTSVLSKLKEIQGVDRSWGFEDAYMEANIHTHEKIFSTEGYDPLFIKRYAEMVSSGEKGRIESVSRSIVTLPSSFGESLKENHFRKTLLDMLGVKYILNKNENLGENEQDSSFPGEEYALIYSETPWQIYENKSVLPRFFLTDSYIVEANDNKIIQMIYDQKREAKTVVLEEDLNMPIEKGVGKLNLKEYSPNKISFSLETENNNILFLSDNFFPGWKAFLDNKEIKIYRANYSFRSVAVPEGNHVVEFKYEPKSFKKGLMISSVSLIALFIFIAYVKKIENKV